MSTNNRIADTFDKRASLVHATLAANKGEMPKGKPAEGSTLLSGKAIKENVLLDLKAAVKQMDALRSGTNSRRAVDVNLDQFVKDKFAFSSLDSFYTALGLNPSHATVDSLMTMPEFDEGYRWLVPEVVREAVRLGLRRNPVYGDLIAAEETVTQTKVTLPHVNMSDATPKIIGETETIPVGSVSFGEKDVRLHKIGTGLKVSDEVQKYVSLNVLSLYLQDAGVKLGLGLDTMAIDVLLNGEDGAGTYSAPVIGVDNVGSIAYKDLLRTWLRMGRIGRTPTGMLSNEEPALEILLMDEFKKWSGNTNVAHKNIRIKTPIPQGQDYLIHGAMPAQNRLLLVDNTAALMKLNSTALTVESERIVERQLNGTYMTLTTGFATLFRDARIIIDSTLAYASNGFPDWMDVGMQENVIIE